MPIKYFISGKAKLLKFFYGFSGILIELNHQWEQCDVFRLYSIIFCVARKFMHNNRDKIHRTNDRPKDL
jgi:hypothetical protein